MTKRKRTAIGILLAIAALAAVGLSMADTARPDIERDLRRQLVVGRVQGHGLGGAIVPADRIPVASRIAWPFVVEASYLVPIDLHGRLHREMHLVLPWGRRRLSSRDDVLL